MTETSTPATVPNRRPTNEDISGTIVQLHATTVQLQLDDGSFLHLPYDSLFGQPFTVSAPPHQG